MNEDSAEERKPRRILNMSIELSQLLEGLDSSTQETVIKTINTNSESLKAKLFIDGDDTHYVPEARFAEVVSERNQLKETNETLSDDMSKLSSQLEEGSKAKETVTELQSKLNQQIEISKNAAIKSHLASNVNDSIAPIEDLLAFMDLSNVTVKEDGTVEGLDSQLASVREKRSYLFKENQGAGEPEPQPAKVVGTGNPGSGGSVGNGTGAGPKDLGAFGKQLAQQVSSAQKQTGSSQYFQNN